MSNGDLWSWGDNALGQAGQFSSVGSVVPGLVFWDSSPELTVKPKNIRQIACTSFVCTVVFGACFSSTVDHHGDGAGQRGEFLICFFLFFLLFFCMDWQLMETWRSGVVVSKAISHTSRITTPAQAAASSLPLL
jgi:hypothetical protein